VALDGAHGEPHAPFMTRRPQIVASGGGGFSMEPGNRLLDDYVLSLTGVERPRVCFMPTASGDADHYIVRFYRAFPSSVCEPTHVSLFRRDRGCGMDADVAGHLLEQDLIYVGGGSLLSLLGVWRAHGLDDVLRDCWARGTVLCGLSAGSLCWFSEVLTAFHGMPRRAEGLGLLPWSNCVHYDGEPERREAYLQSIENGMVPGYAAENGAALHFVGGELARVVASRDGAQAYRVEAVDGVARETALPVVSLRGTAGLVLA
jgi:dipeptidase E